MNTLLEIGLSNAVMASLLAVLAAAISYGWRRPAVVHALWLLVLLKLVTPPIVRIPLPWPTPAGTTAEPGNSSPAGEELAARPVPGAGTAEESGLAVPPDEPRRATPAPHDLRPVQPSRGAKQPEELVGPEGTPASALFPASLSWPAFVVPLWLAGSSLWFAWMVWHVYRFQRLLRYARPAGAELQGLVKDLAKRMGLTRAPAVWLIPGAVSPMLWALGGAPRLLFPAKLLECLDREQQMTLLVHELAHLRRRDHWVRLLEIVALGLYWWHPVVWWARRELHEAEEQSCDAWVVATLADAGRAYALALLQTVAFFSQARSALPVAASGIGQVPHLRRRLTMIMQGRTPKSLSWVGGCAVFGLGLLLLPAVPLWAQVGPDKLPTKGQPGEKTNRKEKIEILKKAIQILEEQERAEEGKKAPDQKKNEAQIKKVQAEVKALAREVEVRREELQKAEARLKAALGVLAKLGAKLPPTDFRQPSAKMPYNMAYPKSVYGYPKVAPNPSKADQLEKKLDWLLKEVEKLRQELRSGKSQNSYQPGYPKKKTP
jgi:beta-lactamase regulating signal transducer with metallopeptidase domain